MKHKKNIRENFRNSVYARDNFCCVMCGLSTTKEKALDILDAHHIIDRNLIPNGGYVKNNGISLCAECHIKAEQFHSTGVSFPGYSPDDLFKKINSSKEKAIQESLKL